MTQGMLCGPCLQDTITYEVSNYDYVYVIQIYVREQENRDKNTKIK